MLAKAKMMSRGIQRQLPPKTGHSSNGLPRSRAFFQAFWTKFQNQSSVEEQKLENQKMQLEIEKMKLEKEHRTQLEEMELEKKKLEQEEQFRKHKAQQASDEKDQLCKPKSDLVAQAQKQMAFNGPQEEKLLQDLQTRGMTFYSCPVYITADCDKIEQAAKDALQPLPEKTREAVARLLHNSDEMSGTMTIYEYKPGGNGELTKLIYRMARTDTKKSVALMPFGASFEVAKFVVDHIETVTEQPVFEEVAEQQIDYAGMFGTSYKPVFVKKRIGTTVVKEKKPIFDDKVFPVNDQFLLMNALETKACCQVVKYLG
mmetsp:Transcript_6421/g.11748  ORF Transcript_6421/g.11748 Transcript_6421/m.11748 type:complete len:315 (+) Transcript_6421:75-1019(+)